MAILGVPGQVTSITVRGKRFDVREYHDFLPTENGGPEDYTMRTRYNVDGVAGSFSDMKEVRERLQQIPAV